MQAPGVFLFISVLCTSRFYNKLTRHWVRLYLRTFQCSIIEVFDNCQTLNEENVSSIIWGTFSVNVVSLANEDNCFQWLEIEPSIAVDLFIYLLFVLLTVNTIPITITTFSYRIGKTITFRNINRNRQQEREADLRWFCFFNDRIKTFD